jgi:hypothetical protein
VSNLSELFPEWYRVADTAPTDDTLEKRQKGVEAFAEFLSDTDKGSSMADVVEAAQLCFESSLPVETIWPNVTTMRAVFQKADKLFPMRGNDFELRVLAGASFYQLIWGYDSDTRTAAALAISCGNCRGQGATPINADVLTQTQRRLPNQSHKARLLQQTSAIKVAPVHAKLGDGLKTTQAAITAGTAPDTSVIKEVGEHFGRIHAAIGQLTKNIDATNDKILKNQKVFQEETDILWWLTGEQSRDLGQPLSEVGLRASCLIAPKELADKTLFVPGHPASRSFLARALERAKGKTSKAPTALSLADVIAATPVEWRREWMKGVELDSTGPLLPVLSAVSASLEIEEGDWSALWRKRTGLKKEISLSPLDLAEQVFEECLLARLIYSRKANFKGV